MTIRAVFFDAAGTLIKPARRVGESYAAVAANHGMQVAPAALSERFRKCFNGAPRLAFPNAAPERIERMERDWWKQLVAEIFEPWGSFENFDEYFAELFAYFAQPGAWALYPEVLETLAALRARGLTLAVISNFDSRLLGILDGLGAAPWFDEIFVSSRVGFAKPDRQIFERTLKTFALKGDNALHIGDSETNDLHGARNAGLRALLVDRSQSTGKSSNDRVASLLEILSWLNL